MADLEEREARFVVHERAFGARGRGVERERDRAPEPREQCLQVVDRLRLARATRQGRVREPEHRGDRRLIGREQQVRIFAGGHVDAVAHVEQPLHTGVIPAVRAVREP